jgi:hypothetical protein
MAFFGNTAAVIHDAILNRAPTPLTRLNQLPPELERIVLKYGTNRHVSGGHDELWFQLRDLALQCRLETKGNTKKH